MTKALAVPLVLATIGTAAAGTSVIRIRPGDTLWGIARSHHTTVATLRKLNHISPNSSLIVAGQLLRVPGNNSPGVQPLGHPHAAAAPARTRTVVYTVRSGDTLTGVAAHFHVQMAALRNANHIRSNGMIFIGQHLRVTVALPRPSTRPAVRHYASATVAAAAHHRALLAHRAVPSRSQVRTLIVQAAHRYGVDPSLALAIAYQESGFNQRVVSDADAIGAMQVLPSTARWIGSDVVGHHLDLLNASDNVTAGVALLAQLTRAASTPNAVAGYYQGLGSVEANGMYADTKAYVANVLALRARFRG